MWRDAPPDGTKFHRWAKDAFALRQACGVKFFLAQLLNLSSDQIKEQCTLTRCGIGRHDEAACSAQPRRQGLRRAEENEWRGEGISEGLSAGGPGRSGFVLRFGSGSR